MQILEYKLCLCMRNVLVERKSFYTVAKNHLQAIPNEEDVSDRNGYFETMETVWCVYMYECEVFHSQEEVH